MKVGVLALQGDFEAHARALRSAGATPVEVRTADELAAADALVIPGGESTTLRIVGARNGVLDPIRDRLRRGMPVFGTCAGMIACADRIAGGEDPIVGGTDITVERNAYGRQVDSFETDVEVRGIGRMRAVFIRAPRVVRVGPDIDILAEHDGAPVALRSSSALLTSFHPELTDDDRLHRAFLDML